MNGNLVALSASSFENDIIWGSVEKRSELDENGQLTIFVDYIESADETITDLLQRLVACSGSLVLIDGVTLLAAYEPVLRSIQSRVQSEFPFLDELVNCEATKKLSLGSGAWFKAYNLYTDGGRAYVDSFVDWVHRSSCRLDESQLSAIQLMLKNRVVIVQGPPGTGKTFIGVRLVKVLLDLKHKDIEKDNDEWCNVMKSPILVLTYKNHALDDFSRSIVHALNIEKQGVFLRLGRNSKDENMKKYSLKNLVGEKSDFECTIGREIKKLNQKIKSKFQRYRKVVEKCLDVDLILKFFDSTQIGNLVKINITESDLATRFRSYNSVDVIGKDLSDHIETKQYSRGIKYLMNKLLQSLDQWLPTDEETMNIVRNTVETSKHAKDIRVKFDKIKNLDENNNDQIENLDENNNEIVEEKVDNDAAESREMIDGNLGAANLVVDQNVDQGMLVGHDFDPYGANGNVTCLKNMELVTMQLAQSANIDRIRQVKNPWKMSSCDKVHLVQYLVWEQQELFLKDLKQLSEQLGKKIEQRNRMKLMRKAAVVKKAKVVAMTTSGAAIRAELLNIVKPSVIIVEEAAEVNEAHLIALLGPHVKHLVLIGDHLQLRPKVECFDLVRYCNFDISMMERLIRNNFEFRTLETQSRMRPDVSKYLTDIYPTLIDSSKVSTIYPVNGLRRNFVFWHHEYPEVGGKSFINKEEAKSVVDLVCYFVHTVKYDPSKITVLTGYRGQKHEIRRLLEATGKFKEDETVYVNTIDMYQGSENSVIIVSLVRSSPNGGSGFMGVLNRRCVAQSRGKSGVIFVGNSQTLIREPHSAAVWSPLLDRLKFNGSLDRKLLLHCPRHPYIEAYATVGQTFSTPNFCLVTCGYTNDCCFKHSCSKSCQPAHSHGLENCEEKVKISHACGKEPEIMMCNRIDIDKCTTEIDFTPKCGIHSGKRKCYELLKPIECEKKCEYLYHSDGNETKTEANSSKNVASDESSNIAGLKKTQQIYQSNRKIHRCTKKCGEKHSHDACCEIVEVTCKAGLHKIETECHKKKCPPNCTEQVGFTHVDCGHKGTKSCYESPSKIKCKTEVEYKHPKCGHRGLKRCSDQSLPRCKEKVKFTHVDCGHRGTKFCYEKISEVQCNHVCGEVLDNCGHPCPESCTPHAHDCEEIKCLFNVEFKCADCGSYNSKKCHQESSEIQCENMVMFKYKCGRHSGNVECFRKASGFELECTSKCDLKLKPCGHPCPNYCIENHSHDSSNCRITKTVKHRCGNRLKLKCYEKESDVICQFDCDQILSCGHPCALKCEPEHNHNEIKCDIIVNDKCPNCNRPAQRKCSQNIRDIKCNNTVCIILPNCGHQKFLECHQNRATYHKCDRICGVKFEQCKHKCRQLCGEVHDHKSSRNCTKVIKVLHDCGNIQRVPCNQRGREFACNAQCPTILVCGHQCIERSCDSKHRHSYQCHQKVEFSCKKCMNLLTRLCFEKESEKICTKKIAHMCTKCSRLSETKCNLNSDSFACVLPCTKILQCGHKCLRDCFENCNKRQFCKRCEICRQKKEAEEFFPSEQSTKNSDVHSLDKSEMIKRIETEIDELPVYRFSRFTILEVPATDLDLVHMHALKYFSLKNLALEFVALGPKFKARVEKVAIVEHSAARRSFLQRQKNLNDPRIMKTFCYYSPQASNETHFFCEYGLHSAMRDKKSVPVMFSRVTRDLDSGSGGFITVLACEVLTGSSKILWQKDSMPSSENLQKDCFDSVELKNGNSSNSVFCVFDPYQIFVIGYVSLYIECIDENSVTSQN